MTAPTGLLGGLRRLGTGLIAYGLIGLVVATIGFGGLVLVNGRFSAIRHEVEATLAQRATTMRLAARVLRDAATTAQSFTVTLDQSSRAVSSLVGTIVEVRSDLNAVEAQLRSFNILGATPLSAAADDIGRIATSMDGLDARFSLIADSLDGDRVALAATARSLGQLADNSDVLATRLDSGLIGDSLGDIQRIMSVTLLVLTIWLLVPALGALGLGIWLRRTLVPDEPTSA
ncbi:MAG: hypothetical protein WEE50_08155 [Chloroflexota bacterium]